MNVKPDLEPQIDREDVDDIVGLAEQIRRDDEEKLTLEEMKAVGRELDIKDEHIERAAKEHRARVADKVAADRVLAKAQRARVVLLGRVALAAAALAVVSVVVVWVGASSARSDLAKLSADVDAKRAQLESVRQRQDRVEAEYRARPPGPDRDAELMGAENRVRVEQRRYDEVAAQYNAEVESFFGGWAVRLYDLRERAPLSNEP